MRLPRGADPRSPTFAPARSRIPESCGRWRSAGFDTSGGHRLPSPRGAAHSTAAAWRWSMHTLPHPADRQAGSPNQIGEARDRAFRPRPAGQSRRRRPPARIVVRRPRASARRTEYSGSPRTRQNLATSAAGLTHRSAGPMELDEREPMQQRRLEQAGSLAGRSAISFSSALGARRVRFCQRQISREGHLRDTVIVAPTRSPMMRRASMVRNGAVSPRTAPQAWRRASRRDPAP